MEIQINNGKGTAQIKSGTYSVSTVTKGYDDTSLIPKTVEIDKTTTDYNFTVAANGTLTLHVSETGEASGTPVVGATFIRCDSTGNEYGNVVTSNAEGNAIFEHVPFDTTGINFYFKQKSSDATHEFDDTLKTLSLTTSTTTEEIQNTLAITRTINLVDQYYSNYPIENSTMTLV